MTRLYDRVCRLKVGSMNLNLDNMHVEFLVRAATIQSPNIAEIRLFNLSDSTKNAICIQNQTVILEAGYRERYGAIFKGTIKQANRGRTSPTETIVDLFCGDGDQAYVRGQVSKTLKAGATRQDVVNECLKAFAPYGVSKGWWSPKLTGQRYPRPVVMFGLARDHMRRIARELNADWSIQSGKLNFVGKTESVPSGSDIVLNSSTGLVGRATQTFNGIIARAFINPALQIDSIVKIDEKSIDRAAPLVGLSGYEDPKNSKLPSIAADGRYRVYGIDRTGSIRGTEWYDTIYCANASDQDTFIPKALINFQQ